MRWGASIGDRYQVRFNEDDQSTWTKYTAYLPQETRVATNLHRVGELTELIQVNRSYPSVH